MQIINVTNKQRKVIERIKNKAIINETEKQVLEPAILSSWQRSKSAQIPVERLAAPLNKNAGFQTSLDRAMQLCSIELKQIAEFNAMVIAVADTRSMIHWTECSKHMYHAAEQVHFVKGAEWREDLVGTNALALSLRTQQSSCVFSNEHYMSSIYDWVCYAAPIFDQFQQLVGVIDLSTTWKNHNSLGILAAERCASIIQKALKHVQQTRLVLKCFGTPRIQYQGREISLTPRQIEIVTILTLCKQGLTLDQLHQALYGERKVSMGTLKAEMSQLRELLGGMLGSRPYRLLLEVDADFLKLEEALDADLVQSALSYYTGSFLSKSESPFLRSWRDCLESRLSTAIFKINEKEILLKHIAYCPDAVDAVERLVELIPEKDPMHRLFSRYQD